MTVQAAHNRWVAREGTDMADLQVRKISFAFDGVEFLWNPTKPEFSLLSNILSFQTIGFERFICRSMHDALPFVKDERLRREMRDFSAQEMSHSQAHMKHVRSIIDQYPDLQEAFDDSLNDFDRKWDESDLYYRLAYSAIIEATSLPLYKVILDHRQHVMAGGDPRVISLLLWHFCEEVEHCGSALRVYDHVVASPWYRLKVFPEVGQHLASNMMRIAAKFADHVPEVAGLDLRKATKSIPAWPRFKMVASLLNSQMPWYNPEAERKPAFLAEWKHRYDSGEDISFEMSS